MNSFQWFFRLANKMIRFQVISCLISKEPSRSLWLYPKLWILRKMTYFKKMNKMNTFQWNYRFQGIFKREPYTVCSFFTENCLFLQNHQISMKLQISVLLSNFQKRAFYHSSLNEQNEQFSVTSADLKK